MIGLALRLSIGLILLALLALGVGQVLPRSLHLLYSSSGNWQAGAWNIYLLDVNRGLNQRLLASRTDTVPGLPVVWSPDGAAIAYLSAGGGLETYLVDPTGKHKQRLNNAYTDAEYNAAWSPDGRKLAFIGERGGARGVYLANADGSQPRLLALPGFKSLVWSPDSRRLALESDSREEDIFILDVDTGEVFNFSQSPGKDLRPAWSPDGEWLAFLSSRDSGTAGSTRFNLYVARADGSDVRHFTDHFPADSAWLAHWSPDGTRLVFGSVSWTGGTDIYIVDVQAGIARNLTNDNYRDAAPVWSPDGKSIAFESRRDSRWGIYLASAAGGQITGLTDVPADSRRPVWSPDGQRLVYIANPARNWDLYLLDLADGQTYRLTRQRSIEFSPVWRP